jgi:putative membrane protein
MVRDAASEALPFSQVGGMVLGARAAIVQDMPSRLAIASMIVDVTTELLGQLLYVGVGLGILDAHAAHTPLAHTLIRTVLVGLSLATVGVGLFLALQRNGFRWVFGKLAGRLFPVSSAYTVGIADSLRDINRSPLRLLVSTSIHFCGWIAGAMGTWIAFRLVGVPIDAAAVIAIDSVVYAMRSVMFFVPNALGVQEAAYAVLGPLFGIDREFALAISLLKRARDIAVGIPILFACQIVEGRRAFAPRMRA